MNQVSTVGLDLAKYIFQLHGADSAGAVVFRKKLRRGQLLAFLATLLAEAFEAVQHDPRSQAKYAALRARGHGHGRALRSVADRLIGVACARLEAKTTFDPNLASQRALNLTKPTC